MLLRAKGVRGGILRFQTISQPAQVSIVSFGIVRRFRGDDLFFQAGNFRSQLIGNSFRYFGFDRKDVSELAIKGLRPRCESLAALISCTFTRTASPLFCTLPSRM